MLEEITKKCCRFALMPPDKKETKIVGKRSKNGQKREKTTQNDPKWGKNSPKRPKIEQKCGLS
jgi:hypothetical protein